MENEKKNEERKKKKLVFVLQCVKQKKTRIK